MKRRLSKTSALVEGLESRQLLSATVVGTPTIANASKLVGAQSNPTLTINPNNPAELFVVSRNDLQSIFVSHSTDSGATWTGSAMFGLNTGFPQATGVPSVAMDKFGNLFIAYSTLTTRSTVVVLSYDHGVTYHEIGDFARPTIRRKFRWEQTASGWRSTSCRGKAEKRCRATDQSRTPPMCMGWGAFKSFKAESSRGSAIRCYQCRGGSGRAGNRRLPL